MENKDYIYLRFPVQILKCDFYDIKKVCSDAWDYGVIEYMERKKYKDVKGFIQAYKDLGKIIKGFKRSDYSDQSKEEIDKAEELHYSNYFRGCRQAYDQYKDSIETVIVCSIKMDLIFDFLNNKKTEFEIVVFRFFIALNSIHGASPDASCGRGSWDRFFAVMLGYNTDTVLKHGVDDGKYEPIDINLLTDAERVIFEKYYTKRKKEKIKEALEIDWHTKWVSGGNDGIFFSWTLGYRALETIKLKVRIKRKKKKERVINAKKKGREEAYKDLKNNLLE